MTNHVFKYQLSMLPGPQTLSLPDGACPVHVDLQRGYLMLWAQVDPVSHKTDQSFQVVATGEAVPGGAVHVGTVLMNDAELVWHIYALN